MLLTYWYILQLYPSSDLCHHFDPSDCPSDEPGDRELHLALVMVIHLLLGDGERDGRLLRLILWDHDRIVLWARLAFGDTRQSFLDFLYPALHLRLRLDFAWRLKGGEFFWDRDTLCPTQWFFFFFHVHHKHPQMVR